MGNVSTSHSNFPREIQGGLRMDTLLCCPVFNCCPTHMEVFVFLWVLIRIRSPETQKGKSHTCCDTKLVFSCLLLSWVEQCGLLNLLPSTGSAARRFWCCVQSLCRLGRKKSPQETAQERETDIKLQLISHKIQHLNCKYWFPGSIRLIAAINPEALLTL